MRMRKVKWACEYLQQAQCRIKDPASFQSHWPEKLAIEIGCGKGSYIVALAKLNPNIHFVAIEKNESAAGMAAKLIDEAHLANVSLIWGDASELANWFKPASVETIYLTFSDPWPKKRNAKRRLSSASFLESYHHILTPAGQVVMKTDNKDLFAYSLLGFQDAKFSLVEVDLDYDSLASGKDALTDYEEKFVAQGISICRGVWRQG